MNLLVLNIDVRTRLTNKMMYIKVLPVYPKSAAALRTHVNLKMTIYDTAAASRKQEQQARIRRLQMRHKNTSSNRGVGNIGNIDAPQLYSVIPDALVSTPKCHSFATFSLFLLILGSISFITHAADGFPALVAFEKLSFL